MEMQTPAGSSVISTDLPACSARGSVGGVKSTAEIVTALICFGVLCCFWFYWRNHKPDHETIRQEILQEKWDAALGTDTVPASKKLITLFFALIFAGAVGGLIGFFLH